MDTIISFSLFGYEFTIRYFGVFLCMALAAFLAVLYFELKKRSVETEGVLDNLFIILLCGVVGGRLLFVLFNFPYYLEAPRELFRVWYGGFYFEGAFIAALAYVIYWLKKENKPQKYAWLDALLVASLPAQAFTKLGIFFSERNQLDGGSGAVFSVSTSNAHVYEMITYVVVYVVVLIMFWGFHKELRDGYLFYALLILLSVVHLIFTSRFGQISIGAFGDMVIYPSHILFVSILTSAILGLILHVRKLTSY